MRPETARKIAFAMPETVIAAGVAVVAAMLAFWLGCRATVCAETTGLPWLVAGALVGLVVGAGYWIIAWRIGTRFAWRIAFDAIVVVLAVVGFFLLQVQGGHSLHGGSARSAVMPSLTLPMPAAQPRPAI